MANLQEKIAQKFAAATFEQEGDGKLRIVIPHDRLHDLVKDLRDNHRFDYLITIVGMDWKTSLGCIYYLTSSESTEVIAVKTSTASPSFTSARSTISSASSSWATPTCAVSS